jgi:hypothetical protein
VGPQPPKSRSRNEPDALALAPVDRTNTPGGDFMPKYPGDDGSEVCLRVKASSFASRANVVVVDEGNDKLGLRDARSIDARCVR